jgi:hypothetical protein
VNNHLTLRNAHCRATWTLRFYSGATCADAWPEISRAFLDLTLERKRNRAQAWIEAGNQYHRAVQLERASNVVALRPNFLLQRQGG